MKINHKNSPFLSIAMLLLCSVVLVSCSKWDDFKKYTAEGEVLYTGKLDSVKVYSGKERVRVTGLFRPDPNITKCKVFWNSRADSIVFDVVINSNNLEFDKTFAVTEGVKTFEIITYDNRGNSSIPAKVVGTSYGNSFRRKISNRNITTLAYASSNTTVNWDVIDLTNKPIATEIVYTVNGEDLTVVTAIDKTQSVLEDFNYQNTHFKYRTVYRPEVTSIDTICTPYTVR
jgi:hypothetical protein